MNMELTGKKINFLGDSITEGCCATSPEKGYVDVIDLMDELKDNGIILDGVSDE